MAEAVITQPPKVGQLLQFCRLRMDCGHSARTRSQLEQLTMKYIIIESDLSASW